MDTAFPRHEAELALLEAAMDDPMLQATIDVVRERVICPVDANPKNFGEVITQMKANGLIRKVGHAYTERRVAQGRDVAVWQIVDVEAARHRVAELRVLIKKKTGRRVAAFRPVQKELF